MKASLPAVGLVIWLLWPLTLVADYQAGLDAYRAGDYDRAFFEWMKVTDSPETEAHPEILAETCYALGMLFWVGQGVQQDTAESALWLRKAAELNHPEAQVKLGYLYSSGQGVPQSDFEAMKWIMMAARQGDADAQYNLGVVYRDGLGVEVDANKSLQWFREAAANGDAVSAGIVAEWEGNMSNSARAPALQNVEEPRQPTTTEAGKPGAPVNPQSPWWVDIHGRNIETEEAPAEIVSARPAAVVPQPVPEPRVVADPPVPVDPPGRVETTDEMWLRSRDPERFTIQVIALLDVQKLHAFIARNPEWQPFALYLQEWKGQPLWVLVQGDYPDVIRAREAARKFPTDIQKRDKLWIRKFVMVQGLLK